MVVDFMRPLNSKFKVDMGFSFFQQKNIEVAI
jgi:hypothetical protein